MAETIAENDNRSSREKVYDPDLEAFEDALKALIAEAAGRIRTTDMFERITDALLRLVKSNPYRIPGDIAALKPDLWMLYSLSARLTGMLDDYERAVARGERPDAPPSADDQPGGASS